MKFLIQSINNTIADVETFNLKSLLDSNKLLHQYELIDLNNIDKLDEKYKNYIPVGTLQFVNKFLNKYYYINNLNPIEVPDCLRNDKYLKRKYSIIDKKDLPTNGRFFIKYVSKLKNFTYIGDINDLSEKYNKFSPYKKDGLYEISEIVNVLSEYRTFVYNDEIQAIQYYDGNCLIFPDSRLLQEMVNIYSLDKDRPKAYTMDIAVIPKGTCILEVHPMTSCGTYGYNKKELIQMYREGIEYYKNINKSLNLFSNF